MSWMEGLDRRVSDADRDRVAAALRDHLAEGRLTHAELEGRLELVYNARTAGDLVVVTQDLPTSTEEPEPKPAKREPVHLDTGFRIHAGIWAVFALFWILIWAMAGFGYFWPVWPAAAWGVAVGIHGVVSYNAAQERRRRGSRRPRAHEPAAHARQAPATASGPTRQWLSVMFTDIANSTSLTEALGDEEWSAFRRRHREMLQSSFSSCGGREVGSQGDGFLARFDDPANAVQCAVDIQRRLAKMRDDGEFVPKLRIGIHAGEVVQEQDGDVLGRVVNLAARVTSEAQPGEILVTEPVADRVEQRVDLEDRGVRTLKGVARPRHLLAVRWTER